MRGFNNIISKVLAESKIIDSILWNIPILDH